MNKRAATKVLNDIRKTYRAYIFEGDDGPNLRDYTHEEMRPGEFSIDWEEGPYEWAYDYAGDYHDFRGAFLEPINTFTLGLYNA